MRGHFITFEGGEGSGKSTHAKTLAQRLKSAGIEIVLTREPGGSTGAEIIRHILLSGIAKPLGAETEAILFAAARDDHVRTTILPALNAGQWVICDRFIDSTRVYQGILGNVDQRLIRSLERVTVGSAFPELTFIMDVPAQVGLARAKSRRGQDVADRFEAEFDGVSREVAPGLSGSRRRRAGAVCPHRRSRAARGSGRAHLVDCARAAASRDGRTRGGDRIVSRDESDDRDIKLPRETTALFGHDEAEGALLDAYKSGRIPHAWLIGGPPGIGKATLAFRLARFMFVHPDPHAPAVQKATSLAVDPDHPVARRIATQAQNDLLVLERGLNEQTGKPYTVIRVDDVRRTVSFFGSTAGEGGWRIAIVDAVDDLQREGANALLKVLEEPPRHSLLLLVSHAPGRELPTIRSRCRRLLLRPLATDDVIRALTEATGASGDEPEVIVAAEAAEGSAGRAASLLDGSSLALRQRILDLFAQLPNPDPLALHALGDAIGGTDPKTLEALMDLVNGWLSARLAETSRGKMARVAETWEKVNQAARDAEAYNLERKPLVFAIFGALAEAARN